jgi:uncharacterized protein (DUF924 family)
MTLAVFSRGCRVLPSCNQSYLDFWFAPPTDPAHTRFRLEWFRKDPQHDAEIARRFSRA